MTVRTSLLALGAAAALMTAGPPAARAGSKDFIIYAPGMGGSAAQAKPYLDTFFKYLEKKLGWAEHSGTGEYFDDPRALAEHIESRQPGFALVPPGFYLDLVCKKTPLTPIAAVVGVSNTSGSGRFHIVARKDTPKSLDALKGKKLASNHLEDRRFISRVVFDGKIDAETFFQLNPVNSPVKPIKLVASGAADAALLDDAQFAYMKTLPSGKDLDEVFASQPLPPYSVVAFDKVAKPAERDAVKKALVEMCGTKEGRETCKSMTVTRFEPVDSKVFQSAAQRYCKP